VTSRVTGPMRCRASPQGLAAAGLLLIILLLALGLRFYRIDHQSLWNDEGTSVALAQRDLVTIAREAARDIHPPLYYWLLNGWVRLAGSSELGIRSLSALLGLLLVALTYAAGSLLGGKRLGVTASLLAAISPFQVYYSQEARMYMLAAVLASGAMVALVRFVRARSWSSLAALILLEAAGLYTHYSFVFILLVLNVAYLLRLRKGDAMGQVGVWMASQAAVLLLYLPWLPSALRQVTTWPSPAQRGGFLPNLATEWRWLVLGPTIEAGEVAVPLTLAGALVVWGMVSLVSRRVGGRDHECWWTAAVLALWLGVPVLLMFILGLYREAYLKFLLVASPAVGLLLAAGLLGSPLSRPSRDEPAGRLLCVALRVGQLVTALVLLAAAGVALYNAYTDPVYARDDYRGIAGYVMAVGRGGDAILLNAPGQQEVFGYYYDGDLPIHPLPKDRPLDPADTSAALEELAKPGRRIYAVLWATDESDPQRFIESWLDGHAYKALDSWYGNVRLVVYSVPVQTPTRPDHVIDISLSNGDTIHLAGYSMQQDQLAAGDIAQITLFWQVDQVPARRYKVFVHILDEVGQIVGQRDAEPGGGARLTTQWEAGATVADHYGVLIHPATPPGTHRVEVGLYDPETGERLITPEGGSQIWLQTIQVLRSPTAPPAGALGMAHEISTQLGDLTLLGYDAHKLGFAHEPQAALRPGDLLHVNLYWLAERNPGAGWRMILGLQDSSGQPFAALETEPVVGFPTSQWQAGDIWRGQFNLMIPRATVAGRYRLRIETLNQDGASEGVVLLPGTIRVEP
jgi:mannosyltransferase